MPSETASWIDEHRQAFSAHCVASLVPEVFAAYARILHPAWSPDRAPVRWDTVAAWSGRTASPLAQWDWLSAPDGPRPAPAPFSSPPDTGGLPHLALTALLDVLRRHTATADQVSIAIWEGYGWIPDHYRDAAVLDLEDRSFLVRVGPLTDALEIEWRAGSGALLHAEPPTLIWPADRAWFVASDTDLDSTYLGGTQAAIRDVLGQASLEAWAIASHDGISLGSDTRNTPGP